MAESLPLTALQMMQLQCAAPAERAAQRRDDAEPLRLFGQDAEAAVRLAYHLTRDREAALDISQEAFVKAIQCAHTLKDAGRARAWFHSIVVNLSRDWIRERANERKRLTAAGDEADHSTPDEAFSASETAEQLRAALMKLPAEFREAVVLVCIEEYSPKEAADVLQIPAGTLRWRLHEGRQMLKKMLKAE